MRPIVRSRESGGQTTLQTPRCVVGSHLPMRPRYTGAGARVHTWYGSPTNFALRHSTPRAAQRQAACSHWATCRTRNFVPSQAAAMLHVPDLLRNSVKEHPRRWYRRSRQASRRSSRSAMKSAVSNPGILASAARTSSGSPLDVRVSERSKAPAISADIVTSVTTVHSGRQWLCMAYDFTSSLSWRQFSLAGFPLKS